MKAPLKIKVIGWGLQVAGVAFGTALYDMYGWKAVALAAAFDFLWASGRDFNKAVEGKLPAHPKGDGPE